MVRIRGPTGWTPLDIVEQYELAELGDRAPLLYSGDKTFRGDRGKLPNLRTQVQGSLLSVSALSALASHIGAKKDEQKTLTELHGGQPTVDTNGLVLPPFKYLGPGNSLNRGQPFNQIDADAQVHDIQYSQAKNSKDVQDSDKEFLRKSGDHIAEGLSGKGSISDTLGAIAGGLGIGTKYSVEKAIGKPLYPSISGKYATAI